MCFGIDLISSFAVWRPSGVVEGLQTPPGTPDGVWRPSRVKSSLEALRGLKACLEALRRCAGPPDTSRHPKS